MKDRQQEMMRELADRMKAVGFEPIWMAAAKEKIQEHLNDNAKPEKDAARKTAEYWKAEHLAGNAIIDSLRAALAEAQRQLKEAIEQEPVGCMSPEQFSILTGDPVDNGVHVRIWQVYNPPSRAKSGVKLYAAPVPQPADDFRARLIALCQQWTPANLDRCETAEEIIREVAEGPHRVEPADAALADEPVNLGNVCAEYAKGFRRGREHEAVIRARQPAQAVAVPEGWISVDDRKPDHLQDVIFVVRDNKDSMYNGRVLGGRFVSSGGGEWSEFVVPGISFFASYWMPAPQPPALLAASKGEKP